MRQQFSCGQTRRESLWNMGAGFTGTAMTGILASDGFFNQLHAEEQIRSPRVTVTLSDARRPVFS